MVSSSDLFDDSSPIPKQRLLTKTRVRSNVRGTVRGPFGGYGVRFVPLQGHR